NKKTGQVTIIEKEKTIKKPLKYDTGLSDKTKIQRLKNLKEYEEAVRRNPPQKIDLYDQIAFEKDSLGYASSTWSNVDGRYALV
ncbi:hypothetical protein NSX58_26070, partial [Salmonella enterica]|nr:hypothetical protein [Salmonella enterica]